MSTPTKKSGTATGKRTRLYWGVPAALVALVLVVLLAKWLTGAAGGRVVPGGLPGPFGTP